jgi:glyoxylase-like metal-dependent hydrolase (beta-lactamase superfamily II)
VIVGHSPAEVAAFFGLPRWFEGEREDSVPVEFALGGSRSLRLFWIRGHEDSHVAVYDAATHVLVTGDVLYPGEGNPDTNRDPFRHVCCQCSHSKSPHAEYFHMNIFCSANNVEFFISSA